MPHGNAAAAFSVLQSQPMRLSLRHSHRTTTQRMGQRGMFLREGTSGSTLANPTADSICHAAVRMLLLPAAWLHTCMEAWMIPVAGREPLLTSLCRGRGDGMVLSNALPPRHIRPYKTRSDDSEKMLRARRTGAGSFWKALSSSLHMPLQLPKVTH